MDTITITNLRARISECISRVAFGGDRLLVKRGKNVVAAIVPYEDYVLLEELYADADRVAFEGAAEERTVSLEEQTAVSS